MKILHNIRKWICFNSFLWDSLVGIDNKETDNLAIIMIFIFRMYTGQYNWKSGDIYMGSVTKGDGEASVAARS